MSTLSSSMAPDNSSTPVIFHDPCYSDPYLSAPLDPEQDSFGSSAIRLTPNPDDRPSSRNPSPPPLNLDTSPSNHDGHTPSYSDFLSPSDLSSDFSNHTPPSTDHLSPHMSVGMASPPMTMDPLQLLSPNLSHNHTPSPDRAPVKGPTGAPALHFPHPLSMAPSPASDGRSAHDPLADVRGRSPIVKVESYSRGDSPVRGDRRPSQSFTHLSPHGGSAELDEDEDDNEDHHHHHHPHPHNDRPAPGVRSVFRGHDGAWIPNDTTGQAGVDPTCRTDDAVLSPSQMEMQRQLEQKNADIQMWSESVSEAGDDRPPLGRGRRRHSGVRPRAKSTGDRTLQQDYFQRHPPYQGTAVPGPGLLVHESEGEEEDSDDDDYSESESGSAGVGSPPVAVDEARWTQEPESMGPDEADDDEPSPHQFLGSTPWKDPAHDATPRATRVQPPTSTAAMVEWERRARETDTASRAATWGTKRISQYDAASVIGAGASLEGLTISNDRDGKPRGHIRRNSLLKFLQKRPSASHRNLSLKRPLSDVSLARTSTDATVRPEEPRGTPPRKDSFPHRLSISRSSRSPSLSTGGAVMAIAGQMAAIGGKDTLKAVSPNSPPPGPWSSIRARTRSHSELPSAPGLMDLMTSHDEDEEMTDDKGLVMELTPQPRLPVPTLEGFRAQITHLNPRLPPVLIERFATEQVRRYRKLVESKATHAQAVRQTRCAAGRHCFALGGGATLLAPRAGASEAPDAAHTQFQIPGHGGEPVEDPQMMGEGAVTAAQFPLGVPLPPVPRLPAEFECPVCFSVKKFQKPSDWTKHVHEDVQPFTCTFPHCTEPKSFKRKADWVRHESERHRQLEWWTCEVPDCQHTCYRKDNFVQHLVREHKMPEPKVKKTKGRKGAAAAASPADGPRGGEIEQLWNLVERCRHDTPQRPMDEPCRFCGNVCSSWKKLTVHLAKHMEQIAMPVLRLVDERDLSGAGPVGQPHDRFAPALVGVPTTTPTTTTTTPTATTTTTPLAPYHPDPLPNHGPDNGHGGGPHAGGSAAGMMSLHPTYVVPHLATPSGSLFSAEPGTMDAYDGVGSGGPFDGSGPLSGTTMLESPGGYVASAPGASASYPPPFNAGPRPRASQSELGVLPETSEYTTPPSDLPGVCDPRAGATYVSEHDPSHYAYPGGLAGMAGGMTYPPATGY
ncbi:hypothetical protein P168DRAFT_295055 [Aspergillus campestris IBT 28561]|uniref:C2H2-type domain-containing protein n=1 Tax=Aspergillus campestris (strain IBT 28561) TaxID=1392248 RepID=A0A2I1DAY2_ASPC2|nr:uncharacterized protein P168DRAFT_295055 [Aspergillus campestris IBT 28561]PKY07034.1 hypothetical protein P168DRAFT_295055 [Aspergillus campestris IBT 28561]